MLCDCESLPWLQPVACAQVSRETSILKKLSTGGGVGHPHVVRLFDTIETDMKYYMVNALP
jgi:hypothetical protein